MEFENVFFPPKIIKVKVKRFPGLSNCRAHLNSLKIHLPNGAFFSRSSFKINEMPVFFLLFSFVGFNPKPYNDEDN